MKVIKNVLIDATVEVGIVAGKDAVVELARICGENPFSGDCPKGTIRKRFGKNQPIVFHGITYFLNAIHKASEKEAKSAIKWFYSKK